MIDQKDIIIGTAVALGLLFVLGIVIPAIGGFIALIIAGIVVGWLVNSDLKNGAMNGALVGLFTGMITIILIFFRAGGSNSLFGGVIILTLGLIGAYVILGLVGGIIGSLITSKR
jgi:Family of unknown function (DUF5518)